MKTVVAILALLVLAAPARASTVRVLKNVEFDSDDDFGRDDTETTSAIFSFRAMPGEANRVRVGRRGRRLVFTDRGARLQAGRRCVSRGGHRAVCRVGFAADARFLSVSLGDRDDRAFAARRVRIDGSWYGRMGDDRIRGTGGDDYITGGAGGDVLAGAGGRDNLLGGEGADRLTGGDQADALIDGPGRDVVRGGPGRDTVYSKDGTAADRLDGGRDADTITYTGRHAAVTATLGGTGGAPGENDRLRHFETLVGGDGDDTLTGGDGANVLDGQTGADRLDGRGGDDRFEVSYTDADHVLCGDGKDRIRSTFAVDYLVEPDCERVTAGYLGVTLANPVSTTADTVTVRLPCARSDATDLQRAIELRIPAAESAWYTGGGLGSVVGTGDVPVGTPPARCRTEIALNDSGRALTRPVPVRVSVGPKSAWHFQLR